MEAGNNNNLKKEKLQGLSIHNFSFYLMHLISKYIIKKYLKGEPL
jgi:hypothetical protein